MKKLFLFITIILFSYCLCGQVQRIKVKKLSKQAQKILYNDSIKNLPRRYSYFTIDFYYGNKSFSNSFYDQLNKINKFDLTSPLKVIGFGFSGCNFEYGPRGNFLMQMFYSNYLTNTIHIQDTISSQIKGFSYHFGLGKIFKTKNRKYSFASYLGFNTGRLKLSYADGFKQKNSFFSPKISLQPKIMLTRKISISVIFDYEVDVSKTGWTNINNKSLLAIQNFNQSGLLGLISFGFCPLK